MPASKFSHKNHETQTGRHLTILLSFYGIFREIAKNSYHIRLANFTLCQIGEIKSENCEIETCHEKANKAKMFSGSEELSRQKQTTYKLQTLHVLQEALKIEMKT